MRGKVRELPRGGKNKTRTGGCWVSRVEGDEIMGWGVSKKIRQLRAEEMTGIACIS